MSEVIHDCVKSVEVEPTDYWGKYDYTITFEDNSFVMFRINSMAKTARNLLTCENIEFDYMERFLRPATKRNREKKENND